MNPDQLKFDTLLRFAFIETRLYWENSLTAKDLVAVFDLSRQQAQAVIKEYRAQHPEQMRYDRTKKRHTRRASFKPYHIRPESMAFLDFLRGQQLRAHYIEEPDWSDLEVYDIDRMLRTPLSRALIEPVVSALRHQQTLYINYQAVMEEPIETRIISPNYLAFVDNRYHLHAYCHTLKEYRDFVLSRILSVEFIEEEWVSGDHSKEWQDWLTLYFQPNPVLSAKTKKALLRGHVTENGIFRKIKCRRNAAFYIRRRLCKQLDPNRNIPQWIEVSAQVVRDNAVMQ